MGLKPGAHQKFAVIDQSVVWYGNINLLGYGTAEESIMRLEQWEIAEELLRVVGNTDQDKLTYEVTYK